MSHREEALPISRSKTIIVLICNVENMRNYSFIFIDVKFVLDTLMAFRINFPEIYHSNRCIFSQVRQKRRRFLEKYQVQIFLCIEKIIRRTPSLMRLYFHVQTLCSSVYYFLPKTSVIYLGFLRRDKMIVNANAPIMVMVLMMMAGEGNDSGTVSTCR